MKSIYWMISQYLRTKDPRSKDRRRDITNYYCEMISKGRGWGCEGRVKWHPMDVDFSDHICSLFLMQRMEWLLWMDNSVWYSLLVGLTNTLWGKKGSWKHYISVGSTDRNQNKRRKQCPKKLFPRWQIFRLMRREIIAEMFPMIRAQPRPTPTQPRSRRRATSECVTSRCWV